LSNPPPDGGNVEQAHQRQQAADAEQNRANHQSGGAVECCNNNDDYSYPCPAGMCGPVPQTSSETSNGLIIQAAKITASNTANSEFDTKVANIK
jgi:hypothetical protein